MEVDNIVKLSVRLGRLAIFKEIFKGLRVQILDAYTMFGFG